MSRLDKLPEIIAGNKAGISKEEFTKGEASKEEYMKESFPYKAVVFDLDGTLYDQKKLRINMAARLGIYYACRFWKVKELFVLKYFREVRDKWDEIAETLPNHGIAAGTQETGIAAETQETGIAAGTQETGMAAEIGTTENPQPADSLDEQQYKYVANKKGVSPEYVEKVVKMWIYDNPLDLLKKYRSEKLCSYIEKLQAEKIPVIIFSDYPISDKIKALGVTPDGMYCPGDERNIELKPSPMGLELIMKDYGLTNKELLMVGDRDVKDGEAARRAEVDFVIV